MMAEESPTTPEKPVAEAAGEAAAGAASPPTDELSALRAETADHKDKLMRTLAEMENLRRRTEREIADQRQYAVASFARDMLTVADNLRRAIDAVPKEMRDGRDPALNALIEGVEVTERGLEQSLTKFGVKRVETKGLKFDPSFHQAMFEVDNPEAAPGTVADEIQAGYAIGDRVLRPALVSVVKRPKAAPAAQPSDAEAATAADAANDGSG
jgi:molecular chaperone GrpE